MMELLDILSIFTIYGGILIMVTLVMIFIVIRVRETGKLKSVLNNLAIKMNGKVTNGFGGWGYPVLKFDYKHNLVVVHSTPGSRYTPPQTYIRVELQSPVNEHMHLYKEGFASRIGKKLGSQDIEVGLDSFDKNIMVKGSNEFFVRNILNYEIQDSVLEIIKKYNANIILKGSELLIEVQYIVYDESVYEELINTALKLVDRIETLT